ncbi:MAG TPA: hypothetical protein VIH75_11525 [Candidatus Sulfotelmatobacter sp.]|jgi:hypothetical protein
MMHSWEALDANAFRSNGPITSAFLQLGKRDFRSAGQYIQALPYGRNMHPSDHLIVLTEKRGTCSTKHALVRRLAIEQKADIALVLGIYEMTEQNTPGVGDVLGKYGLATLPEAHCYLRTAGKRIDVTRTARRAPAEPIRRFLHEEEIDPTQITNYQRRTPQAVPIAVDRGSRRAERPIATSGDLEDT